MRKFLLAAGLIAAIAIPAAASAATRCEQHQANNRAAGTVIGAIAGGLLGNAVSHGGGKTGGTVIGAVGGAVVGNQLARSNNACPDGYDAVDDGRGPDARDYSHDSAYAGDGRTWRDQDGRVCSWQDQPGPNGHHWVQACQ
jgi:hypothetical protein